MLQVSYYHASMAAFKDEKPDSILGKLARSNKFALEGTQRDAWLAQILLLQEELETLADGDIYFEFAIPRMGKRADVILLLKGVIFVIEFKVGSDSFDSGSVRQVHDYALDLKNFHKGSHHLAIVPILIATRSNTFALPEVSWADDRVSHPLLSPGSGLMALIQGVLDSVQGAYVVAQDWAYSGYLPTPTIVEAAQAVSYTHLTLPTTPYV